MIKCILYVVINVVYYVDLIQFIGLWLLELIYVYEIFVVWGYQ